MRGYVNRCVNDHQAATFSAVDSMAIPSVILCTEIRKRLSINSGAFRRLKR